MADTIRYDESTFQDWISQIQNSLEYEIPPVEVSSRETLTAVDNMRESMFSFISLMTVFSEQMWNETYNMAALGASLTDADEKARGHFSGKI